MRRKFKRLTKICMAGFRTYLLKCPLQYTVSTFSTWPPKKLQLSHRFWHNPTKVSHFPKLAHSRPDSTLKLLHVQLWYRTRVCGACALKFCCLFPYLKFHNGIKALIEEFAYQFSFYIYNWNLLYSFFDREGQSGLWSSFFSILFSGRNFLSLNFLYDVNRNLLASIHK